MQFQKFLARLDFMHLEFAGVTVGAWLAFALIAVVVFFGLTRVLRLVINRLGRFAARTTTSVDDLIVDLIRTTNPLFLALVSLFLGSLALSLPDRIEALFRLIVTIALLLQLGLWGSRVVGYAIDQLTRQHPEEDGGWATAMGALNLISRIALWSLVVLMILSSLNVDITTLIAGLGVGGVAVALAVQNILGDLFASLSIVFDRPFAVGDFIVVDDILGTVEHVGLKTTRIRSLSGEQLVVSNGDLLRSRIHNYKRLQERRVLFGFGVIYSTPYRQVAEIPKMVREIVEGVPKTRFDRAHFKEYGDSSLNFEVVYFVLDPDYNVYMDIQQEINLGLFKRFEDEHIEFAFPTRTLYVTQTAEPPSGRGSQ